MASERRLINFVGTQQTCYADWSRALLMHYPFNPKYQKNGSEVHVFMDNHKVAGFNFINGTGFIEMSDDGEKPLSTTGQLPNYQEIDIDTYIKAE